MPEVYGALMRDGDFWTTVMDKNSSGVNPNGFSAMKIALLFAGAAIFSATILTPILAVDNQARIAVAPGDFDQILTGSIPNQFRTQGTNKVYTIRKSVLQDMPDSVCIIHTNGHKSGDC